MYEENTRYYDWTSTIQNSNTTGFDFPGSSHSLSHDLNDAPAGRRFLTSNVGNKIRLLSQGAPTGEASAQMDFDYEEVEVMAQYLHLTRCSETLISTMSGL